MEKTRKRSDIQNIVEKSKEKIKTMTKLRHQKEQKFIMQSYIRETNIHRIRDLFKVKLELHDIGRNHGKDRLCLGCRQAKETTEHIIACTHLKDSIGNGKAANLDKMSDRTNLLHLHNFISTYIERRDALEKHDESSSEDQREKARSTDTH